MQFSSKQYNFISNSITLFYTVQHFFFFLLYFLIFPVTTTSYDCLPRNIYISFFFLFLFFSSTLRIFYAISPPPSSSAVVAAPACSGTLSLRDVLKSYGTRITVHNHALCPVAPPQSVPYPSRRHWRCERGKRDQHSIDVRAVEEKEKEKEAGGERDEEMVKMKEEEEKQVREKKKERKRGIRKGILISLLKL